MCRKKCGVSFALTLQTLQNLSHELHYLCLVVSQTLFCRISPHLDLQALIHVADGGDQKTQELSILSCFTPGIKSFQLSRGATQQCLIDPVNVSGVEMSQPLMTGDSKSQGESLALPSTGTISIHPNNLRHGICFCLKQSLFLFFSEQKNE